MVSKKIAVVMGSDSDWPVVEKAVRQLEALGIETEVRVMSAHRTPEAARNFALTAREAGFGAIIAVIGIPVKSSTLDGLDALLSTVQMPSGIPVATVAIDGAQNAALLAAQMLAIYDGELAARLDELRREMEAATLEKDRALREKLEKERN